jgi:hypothetical protein
MIYEFFTEDGVFKLDYADYLKSPELMDRMVDDRRVNVNLGLRQLNFDRRWLDEHKEQLRFVEHMQHQQQECPLRFFLPHCANSPDFNTVAHNFINDNTHIYSSIVAPNRWGKTTICWIKMMVRFGLIPCDPEWEIFTQHGVDYHEFLAPREIGVVSYQFDNHRKTIWPQVIKAWTPKDEIRHKLQWEVPQKSQGEIIDMKCKSRAHLMACSQNQAAFESVALDGSLWDEQGVESKFEGMEARVKTKRSYAKDDGGYEFLTAGAHLAGATPHKLKDRPDTGAGTWYHRLFTGEEKRGMTVKFWQGSLIETPDWIYSEREKQANLAELEEAEALNNKKRIRQIRSRIFGEFESSGGLVYDEYDEDVHVIEDFVIPWDWCAVRMGDHGRANPSAWLWAAISPENVWFIFREYEGVDTVISEDVAEIVRRSGNHREISGHYGPVTAYTEVFDNETYVCDVLDGRTFRTPDNLTHQKIGDLYKNCGLHRLKAAPIDTTSGMSVSIELVREKFLIRDDLLHHVTRKPGAPTLYIFQSCTKLRKNIRNYTNKAHTNDDGNPNEKPRDKDDHDLDALRYGVSAPDARYKKTRTLRERREEHVSGKKRRGYWCPEDSPKRARAHTSRRGPDVFTGV